MNKDLIDDRFGRFREIPLEMALKKHKVYGICLSYKKKEEKKIYDGPVEWQSINAGFLKIPGFLRFFKQAAEIVPKVDAIWACSDSFYGIIGYMLSSKYRIPLAFDLYAGTYWDFRQIYTSWARPEPLIKIVEYSFSLMLSIYSKQNIRISTLS
jgi:hypothetical protein